MRNEKMDCLNSAAPSDEELLHYALEGEELSTEARAHLEQCETCQRRLASYQQANTFLLTHLYRSQCPSGTQLSFYCIDALPSDDRLHIANHLLDCPLCAAEVAATRQFMREVPVLESVPSFAFSAREAVRRIFAVLVKQQAQLVVRGETTESAWPRQYRADGLDLSLHLSRGSSGNYMLLGILTSIDRDENVDAFEGTAAELYPAPGPFAMEGEPVAAPLVSTEVDDLGNIVFSNVRVGEYVMVLRLPGREVVINGLGIEHK
jgi:hypothetical protein